LFARATRIKSSSEQLEARMLLTREELIAAASKLDGFEGGVWLVDREASRFLSVTFWQSEEQLRESEEPIGRLRELAMIKVGGTVESVERYEVVARV
jgi:heme-degrading monooxygenase HmoA